MLCIRAEHSTPPLPACFSKLRMKLHGKKEHLSKNMNTEAERKEDEGVEMLKAKLLMVVFSLWNV